LFHRLCDRNRRLFGWWWDGAEHGASGDVVAERGSIRIARCDIIARCEFVADADADAERVARDADARRRHAVTDAARVWVAERKTERDRFVVREADGIAFAIAKADGHRNGNGNGNGHGHGHGYRIARCDAACDGFATRFAERILRQPNRECR
jgi:hypothetical protein